MDSEIIDAVTGWDSAPTDRGYGGLRSLADDGFTGAVVAGMTWGFMLNGRLLGVFDGDLADFDDESFEAYRAPDPSLPLLYAMQERGGDVRAQYYTQETPLKDADGTLSAGGFTGYVELSENVLSGDYYIVYHGGKSMSAAFVGNSKRLITDDEAFERAQDEIGIYKVIDVDIDLVEIPEDDTDDASASDDESAAVVGGVADADDAESGTDATTEGSASDASDDATENGPQTEPHGEGPASAGAEAPETPETSKPVESAESDGKSTESTASNPADTPSSPKGNSAPNASSPDASATERRTNPDESSPPESAEPNASSAPSAADSTPDANAAAKNGEPAADPLAEDAAPGDDVFSAEAEWRNARSIPSLDPKDAKGETVGDKPRATRRRRQAAKQATRPQKKQKREPSQQTRQSEQSAPKQRQQSETADSEEAATLEEKLSSLKSERDRLESERDALRNERDEHRSRAEELEDRVAELESEVDRLRGELEDAGVKSTDRSMSADEALRGTNLFVRYARKGEATLEKAHAGQAKREEVIENLRLEHHTTFDTEGLGIDGQPYEEFLHETPEYGFAKWVVTDLLYEIGETDNRSSLAGVFDSIPEADRIELYGTVSVPIGEDETEPRNFDVIIRDQMGEPLFVANLNDSRDPATQPMVTQLIKDSKSVANAKETLGSAFVVTKSFFEPEALEAATAETGGGLLSRSKRKSFIKLSRKQGYHLCLVEARSGEFHLNVPDL
ncbi:hypothetical protein C440_14009 [Haloferax mucosum ATCC BAA-1512]|uniref:DUF7527 domain-containing protein n=1 Tax=Haloferax mucosum ATCC BAA-1512 TaxID=662479 RepID=M0I7L2_9EURY|nr:hypothetical protein [Haloferax mucosum]ELZ91434.1 hypothetical protein C440_14009 [Haloferax mucosum ATCC BAA-1512]